MATFWITKYAVSGGIFSIEAEAEYPDYVPAGWVKDTRSGSSWGHFYLNKDAFADKASAVADANNRRKKKITSLRNQIAKLEKADFNV